jgi:hypothetical protein
VVNFQAMPEIRPRHPLSQVVERLWQVEKHARDTQSTQTKDIAIHSHVNANAYDMALKPKSNVIPSSNSFELQQDNPTRINSATKGDSFCIANGCADNQGGKLDDCIGTDSC